MPDRKKRFHTKVRSGCFTCRRRRVKCDEHRPTCNNCNRNSYRCDGSGYGSEQTLNDVNPSDYWVIDVTRPKGSTSICNATSSGPSNSSTMRGGHTVSSERINNLLAWTRCDPFSSFCVESSPEQQRIFDHSVIHQWSQFAPSHEYTELALVKRDVMGYAINNPVTYHSLLYAGACHQRFWNKSSARSSEHDTELLWLKTRAIKAMREAIQQTESEATDDVLIAALMLAVFDTGDSIKRRECGKVHSRKTLTYKLDAEFYAALDVEWRHLNIFYNLVQKRGGILTMRPSALRTSAILFDVFNAYIHLLQPRMEALVPLSTTMSMRTWQLDGTASHTTTILPQGFEEVFNRVPNSPERTSLRAIVNGFALIMQDFEHINRCRSHVNSQAVVPEEQQVIWIRSMIIHELLMLPETFESTNSEETPVLIYEMVRMSCLMICQIWILADNNIHRRMARKQVCKLRPLLKRCTSGVDKLCDILPDFYLWVVVLGLMLAYEDFDMTGDDTCLGDVAPFAAYSMVITQAQAWTIVRGVLPHFLFPLEECNDTGREAWEHACRILSCQ